MRKLLFLSLLSLCLPVQAASVFSVLQDAQISTTGVQEITNSDLSGESEQCALLLAGLGLTLNTTREHDKMLNFGWLGGAGTTEDSLNVWSEDAQTDSDVLTGFPSNDVIQIKDGFSSDDAIGQAFSGVTNGVEINWDDKDLSTDQHQLVGGVFAGSGVSCAIGGIAMDSTSEDVAFTEVNTGIAWDAIIFIYMGGATGDLIGKDAFSLGFVDTSLNQRTYSYFANDAQAAGIVGNALISTDRVGRRLDNNAVTRGVEVTNKNGNSFTATMRDGNAIASEDIKWLAITSSDWDFEVGGDVLPTSGNNTIVTGVDGKFLLGIASTLTSVDDALPVQDAKSNAFSVHLVDDSGSSDEFSISNVAEDASDPTVTASRTAAGLDLIDSSSGTVTLDMEAVTTLNDGDITHTISNNPANAIQYIYLVAGPTASAGGTAGPIVRRRREHRTN